MTCLLVPGRDETKTNLLADTADAAIYSVLFFFVCLFVRLFLVACPICRQELQVSPIFHTFNKSHVKHETPTFLEGSEILSVVTLKAPVAPGTCVMRVPATPAGLWIPSGPIMLVCLLLLTTSSV